MLPDRFSPTDQPTLSSYLHPGWLLDGAGRDDDPHPPVAVAGHGAAPGVHQEADQEACAGGRQRPRHGLGHLAAVERGARGGARGAVVQCSAVQGTEQYLGSGSRPVQHGEHFLALPAIPAHNTLLLQLETFCSINCSRQTNRGTRVIPALQISRLSCSVNKIVILCLTAKASPYIRKIKNIVILQKPTYAKILQSPSLLL